MVTAAKDPVQVKGKHASFGEFLKAVVQVVLLFGSETWVMPSHMGQTLGLGVITGWPTR